MMEWMDGKKSKVRSFKCDERLWQALQDAADRGGRKVSDQIRYLLEIGLGLREPDVASPRRLERVAKRKGPPRRAG